MEKISEFMGKDHRRLDGLLKEFNMVVKSDMQRSKPLFHKFRAGLQRHIAWEEEVLFPVFESHTGMFSDGPTSIMRMEHHIIRELLGKIHLKIAAGQGNITELGGKLKAVLEGHDKKEEMVLYPWFDRENTLTEEERADLFKDIGNMPPERYNS